LDANDHVEAIQRLSKKRLLAFSGDLRFGYLPSLPSSPSSPSSPSPPPSSSFNFIDNILNP
jgi:hypothetical protein